VLFEEELDTIFDILDDFAFLLEILVL